MRKQLKARWIVLQVIVAASVFMGSGPAEADEELVGSLRYEYPSPMVCSEGTHNSSADCSGSASFHPLLLRPERAPVRASVSDDMSSLVGIKVSQDIDGDLSAFEPGEPYVEGCGSVDLTLSENPFVANRRVAVLIPLYVRVCGTIATSGVVDLFVHVPDEEEGR